MKPVVSFVLIQVFAFSALAEGVAFENVCRAKAKEIAAETYRGCITENRKAQIDQLKNEYQDKLRALKEEYDGEIRKMSGASTSTGANNETPAVNSSASESPAAAQRAQQPTVVVKKAARPTTNRTASVRNLPSKRKAVSRKSETVAPVEKDESVMDIPEPIPVENVDGDSQI